MSAITSALQFTEYFNTLIKNGIDEAHAMKAALSWQAEIIKLGPQLLKIAPQTQNKNNIVSGIKASDIGIDIEKIANDILKKLNGGGINGFLNDGGFGRK